MARLGWRFVFTIFLLDYSMLYTEATQKTRLPTTFPPTMMITTVPLPPGGCYVNGRVYHDGEKISTDSGGCGGTMCVDGDVAYWDAWCMFFSSTTTPPPTTIPPTTSPLAPPGGCVYENKVYRDGQKFNIDSSGCGGMMCNYGEVIYWDDWCMFYSSTTTPPPTTIPHTTPPVAPPGGCVYENKVYRDGQKFNIDSSGCGGMMCNYGEVIYWDDWCMFYSSTTTPPPTTIPHTTPPVAPPGGCVYGNKVYRDGQKFNIDPSGCGGMMCNYGEVIYWDDWCMFYSSTPDTTTSPSPPTTIPPTTTPPTTTLTTTVTTTGVSTIPSGCIIRNTFYTLNSRTNTDPCNKCYCTANGEVCSRTICEDITDCVYKFRLKGDCCFICSGVHGSHHSQSILLFLPLLVFFFW